MGKPTDEELKIALAEAARIREHDADDAYMAKALLNLNYRMRFMEDVLQKAKHYLRSGQAGREHYDLIKAIEEADKVNNTNPDDRMDSVRL